MDLYGWSTASGHGWVHHPSTDSEWEALVAEYGGHLPRPLTRVFEVVRSLRCRSVVVENRYVDADYRSEFSSFWSKRFVDRSSFARRLHFFRSRLTEDGLHNIPVQNGYLGYSVIRPIGSGSVGRTMICPPVGIARRASGSGGALVRVRDEVTLFGNRLSVTASPFFQQDGQYLRCAHAAAWMCHYVAAQNGLNPRQLTEAFVTATPSLLQAERSLPSKGMNLRQLQAVFETFGHPALFYAVGVLPSIPGVPNPTHAAAPDTRLFGVICRYLNSGFPVLVATDNHAFVVVGWFREGTRVRFVVNDDQQGPYLRVASPFTDKRGPWRCIMVPLPPKVFLSAEGAEIAARSLMRSLGSAAIQSWQDLGRRVKDGTVSFRTVLCDASEYKRKAVGRRLPSPIVRIIRTSQLSHYVWIVEVHDRTARAAGAACVLAEAIYDSTSDDDAPELQLIAMPGVWTAFPADGRQPQQGMCGASLKWESLLHG